MQQKQKLSRLGLAALLVAAASPVGMDASAGTGARQGVFLAAKCGKGKCSSFILNEQVADNTNGSNDPYNPKYNSYQMKGNRKATPSNNQQSGSNTYAPTREDRRLEDKRGISYADDHESNSNTPVSPTPTNRPNNPNGTPSTFQGRGNDGAWQDNQAYENSSIADASADKNSAKNEYSKGYNTYNDLYQDDYGKPSKGSYGVNTDLNREYNTVNDYDYNRAAATTVNSSQTLNEAQLLGTLNPQGRAIYLNLDPEAKALAIQLASEDSYRDKNLAVKEAQRRMNDRRGIVNR